MDHEVDVDFQIVQGTGGDANVERLPPNPRPAFTTTQTAIATDIRKVMVPPPNSVLGYEMIQVLTYSSGSMMGDPSRVTDPHDHGVQPRHVQEFADLAAARGGSWRIEPR
jgi:hypothetical protein